MLSAIPIEERQQRVINIQNELKNRNIDAYLIHGTESDFGDVLYLSNHRPVFETLGILIPGKGESVLMIGPEAEPFAADRSTIRNIEKMLEYRESAEPEYPDIPVKNFRELFNEYVKSGSIKRLGLGNYNILPLPIYDSVKKALPTNTEIIRAEDIISNLRLMKSNNEIALIKKAHQITEKVLDEILGKLKPGYTELEVVGMILESIYRNGAECEAFPQYIFSGINTRFAITRPTYKKIEKNEMIQLNIGARFGGYSSAIGRPLVIGKMPDKMKSVIKFGLEAHLKTYEWIKEGVPASDIAKKFKDFYINNGYADYFLYGPCHGSGIIEVEKPWVETNSNYELKENMTFMADTFVLTPYYGLRWEDGFRVTKSGVDIFSSKWHEVIEL